MKFTVFFTIVSAIAEMERSLIVERVKAGIRKAKENGKRLGRPKKLNLNIEELQKMREQDFSFRMIAGRVGASPATIYQPLRRSTV